jgi:superfamily II DNA or RNA helicase
MKCIDQSNIPLDTHQRRVVEFLQRDKVRGLLVVHGVGTGKTLTAVTASQCFLVKHPKSTVFVVTPTSLQQNFIKEYNQYMGYDKNDKTKPEGYQFYTIQGLTSALRNKKISYEDFVGSLLIIDEAHNVRTEAITDCDKITSNSRSLIECSKRAKKVLLLSATPLINRPCEIINMMSMVDGVEPMSVRKFRKVDHAVYFNCKISYYHPDASSRKDYPREIHKDEFIVMDHDYLKKYKRLEENPTQSERAYYNAIRRGSNVLDRQSAKIDWVINHVHNSKESDKYVIFSHFLNKGLNLLMNHFKEHNISFRHITGSVPKSKREKYVEEYNEGEIKILLISKAGGEGLDLKNTTNLIIMDPAWNEATHTQVIGRAIRKGSHKTLNEAKRVVYVYRLFLIKPDEEKQVKQLAKDLVVQKGLSIDLYLRNFSYKKQKEIDQFLEILRDSSIEKNKCTKTVPFIVDPSDTTKATKKVKNTSRSKKSTRKSVRKSKRSKKSVRKSKRSKKSTRKSVRKSKRSKKSTRKSVRKSKRSKKSVRKSKRSSKNKRK